MASTSARLSQGKSQANPQLDESFRGTGTIRALTPALRHARSNKSAMLVVLNVAKQVKMSPPMSPPKVKANVSL
jgi:hypothetical protein